MSALLSSSPCGARALLFKLSTPLYGAKVWVDGELRGHTPLPPLELSPGLHLLELSWSGGRVSRLFWVSERSLSLELRGLEAQATAPSARELVQGEAPQSRELTELMASVELSADDQLGLASAQAWSITHPVAQRWLYLELEGVHLSLLNTPARASSPELRRLGGIEQAEANELYVRRLSLRFKGSGLSGALGRGPLSLQARLRPPEALMDAPEHLTLGGGSRGHNWLYADRAQLTQRWGEWEGSAELGRLTEWSGAGFVREVSSEGVPQPYVSQLALGWRGAEQVSAQLSLYGLSRLGAHGGSEPLGPLTRWGGALQLELKGPPESSNQARLGLASAERSLMAALASGSAELLGVVLRGEAELLRAHELYQVSAPWSLWPDAFEGDRARLMMSTEHIRWVELKLESQGGGTPSWLKGRLTPPSAERSGLYQASYLSAPLSAFGPAYTRLSSAGRWRISALRGELESSLSGALWASSGGAVKVTDPLGATLQLSWRSMDRGLLKARLERGPLGAWGAAVVARLAFDELGLGARCERPVSIGLIPVQGLISCGLDVSLLQDVQFVDD